jgi:hypothetical protein
VNQRLGPGGGQATEAILDFQVLVLGFSGFLKIELSQNVTILNTVHVSVREMLIEFSKNLYVKHRCPSGNSILHY